MTKPYNKYRVLRMVTEVYFVEALDEEEALDATTEVDPYNTIEDNSVELLDNKTE